MHLNDSKNNRIYLDGNCCCFALPADDDLSEFFITFDVTLPTYLPILPNVGARNVGRYAAARCFLNRDIYGLGTFAVARKGQLQTR